jgi:hypothetical protein
MELVVGIAIGAVFSKFWLAAWAKAKSWFVTAETVAAPVEAEVADAVAQPAPVTTPKV